MKVFLVGATGVLGRRIIHQLGENGHKVVGLVRRPENEGVIRSLGGEPKHADPFDSESLARAAANSDVVIHAATKIPVKARFRRSDWTENDRIRTEGVRALLDANEAVGARQYIQQSLVWLARPPDGSTFDESSPFRNPQRTYRSMIDGEALVKAASERHGFAASILRCGLFYSADAAHTRLIAEGLARRKLPIIGNGSGIWGLIHAEDAASAFVSAAETGKAGLFHVVDDEPVDVGAFLRAFAERLGSPKPRKVPRFLARLVLGREGLSVFTDSTRTSNSRLRRETQWAPRFPSYREGLDEIVGSWRAEGFPQS